MIKLVNDRVAIVPVENPDKIGSIIVPEIAKDRLNQGFVKYTGPNVQDLKIGMYVIFSGYSGTLVHIEGEGKFIIIPERGVKAIVKDGNSVPVPGLYFHSGNRNENALGVCSAILEAMPDLDFGAALDLARKLDGKGVTTHTAYSIANYETMMNLTSLAFGENADWRNKLIVANSKENELEAKEYLNEEGT